MTTKNRPFSMSDRWNRSSAQSSSRLLKCALVFQLALSGWGCTAQVAEDEDLQDDSVDSARLSAELERPTQAPKVRIPFAPPDLEVAVRVPAQIPAAMPLGDAALVEIRVENTLTPTERSTQLGPILGGSAVNGVAVRVNLAGLQALGVVSDSGFQCVLESRLGGPVLDSVMCTGGALPAGGSTTITVQVRGLPGYPEATSIRFYCGPADTEVIVDPFNAIAERSETNNQVLGTTHIVGCLN